MGASDVASELLLAVGTRVEHSRAVARQAATASTLLDAQWSSALRDAAWLHDVGYAPRAVASGFHPLDGARWLRTHGWRPEVCRLVAWHTRAGAEADIRHLKNELVTEFPPPPELAQAVLTWADLTSSPAGECCTPDNRIADILHRYPPESAVHRATRANLPELLAAAHLVETQLAIEQGVLQ